MEVPTIEFLRECVEDCMRGLQIPVTNYLPNDSWNALFHRMLENDNLDNEFSPWVLPNCYGVGKNVVTYFRLIYRKWLKILCI